MKSLIFTITFLASLLSVSFYPNTTGQTLNCCPQAAHVTLITPSFTDSLARIKEAREALKKDSKAKREKIEKILKQSQK